MGGVKLKGSEQVLDLIWKKSQSNLKMGFICGMKEGEETFLTRAARSAIS